MAKAQAQVAEKVHVRTEEIYMYDWKKTIKKILVQLVFVLIAGVAATYGNNPLYLSIAPILTGITNYLKHHNDK